MKKKLIYILLFSLVALISFSLGVCGESWEMQNSTSDVVAIWEAHGLYNVTVGKIAEEGVLLEDLYCTLTGCTFTGDVDVSGHNVSADWFLGKVDWTNIQNYPANITDNDVYDSDERYINEVANTFYLNETELNGTITALAGAGNSSEDFAHFFVNITGDTMTGDLDVSGHNVSADWFLGKLNWTDLQNWPTNITNDDDTWNNTEDFNGIWVNKTGDTLTGDLHVESASINISVDSNITNGEGGWIILESSKGIFRMPP